MWPCVDLVLTDVTEERIASIFRVEKSASGEPSQTLPLSSLLIFHVAYSPYLPVLI
jgi:hypothetical protein